MPEIETTDPIVQADAMMQAMQTLKDSNDLGVQAGTIAKQVLAMANSFVLLKSTATTPGGGAVFDRRLAASIAKAKSQLGTISPESKAVIDAFYSGMFGA